ncbi:MAG TPA: ASPIC/UnbV domain-containing protein, partial [Bryobacteraceae bacterium]|nr:ASPIC/UnbV domain-containing protein [Bryobacteraceae bacterium]
MSQSDFRLLFGLGAAGTADSVEVQWPGRENWRKPRRTDSYDHGRKGRDQSHAIRRVTALLFALAMAQAAPDCAKYFAAEIEDYQRKDLGKALVAFGAAVQCDPTMTPAHLAIADIYAERGNEGEALAALLLALQIEPKNVMALGAAANLYLKNGLH